MLRFSSVWPCFVRVIRFSNSKMYLCSIKYVLKVRWVPTFCINLGFSWRSVFKFTLGTRFLVVELIVARHLWKPERFPLKAFLLSLSSREPKGQLSFGETQFMSDGCQVPVGLCHFSSLRGDFGLLESKVTLSKLITSCDTDCKLKSVCDSRSEEEK